MKKQILIVNFLLVSFLAGAQMKVNSAGQIGIGAGSASPSTQLDISGQTFLRNYNKIVLTMNSLGTNYGHFYTDSTYNNLYLGGSNSLATIPSSPIMTWGLSSGNVGVAALTPSSRLSVGGSGNSLYTGYFYNSNSANGACGIVGEVAGPTQGLKTVCGIKGMVSPVTVSSGYSFPIGVDGQSIGAAPAANNFAIGVRGIAQNGAYSFGVFGGLSGTGNGASIVGAAPGSIGYPFISGQYAGYFGGRIVTFDDSPEKPSGGSWAVFSDSRLKKDVKDFKDGLNLIRKIRPVNYKYNGVGGLPDKKTNVGIIAQEVEKVAPYCIGKSKLAIKDNEKSAFANNIVGTGKDSTGADIYIAEVLNFTQDGLFWAMLNSIKELDSTVIDLKKQIQATKGQRTLEEGSDQGKALFVHELELANNTVLFQNFPNPFGDGTTIKYFIPDNIKTAQVVFFDEFGNKLNEFKIQEKGMGQLNISSTNLSTGTYSYSLIVNDKVMDTKKMLRIK